MIFDFERYKLSVYDSIGSKPIDKYASYNKIEPGNLLYEKFIKNKEDYKEFLNKFK